MTRFEGRVAMVTGAGSGLGRATALRLAAEGARVACVDLDGEAASSTASEAADTGGVAAGVAGNVTDEHDVDAAVGWAIATWGSLDVVCNVAGIGGFAHTADLPLETWDRVLAVNLTGTFLVCRRALPALEEAGGNIVNVASNAGIVGQPYSAAYCASKGGVVLFTKALAAEYLDRGVRVNVVAPGGMDTPMIASWDLPEGVSMKAFTRLISPLGYAKPEQVANVIAFVASDEANYMTGAVVPVDGGLTI